MNLILNGLIMNTNLHDSLIKAAVEAIPLNLITLGGLSTDNVLDIEVSAQCYEYSEMNLPEITVYSDSGKILHYSEDEPIDGYAVAFNLKEGTYTFNFGPDLPYGPFFDEEGTEVEQSENAIHLWDALTDWSHGLR
jgi:hypothetical protein